MNTMTQEQTEAQSQATETGTDHTDSGFEDTGIEATYSVEDNKLRLYCEDRLDNDLYQRVKAAGFRWAPKQKLFVAPSWTPAREDLCIELAGTVEAEQTSLVERAQAKAERLAGISVKRSQQASAFQQAAQRIAERFEFGQPILVGHHSERKARKDQERMQNAMSKSVKAANSIGYWNRRATGVERHANAKSAPGVRARRIKTLLAQLRDLQRTTNHARLALKLWEKTRAIVDPDERSSKAKGFAGMHIASGALAPFNLYSQLSDDKVSADEAISQCIECFTKQIHSPGHQRWITHTLNRLDYERYELGEVSRYEGDITPVILQAFAREHGTHKPAAAVSATGWQLKSPVALPLHLGEDSSLDLDAEQWRDLMQAVGYEVPEPKTRRASTKKQVPLINPTQEQAEALQAAWNAQAISKYGHLYPDGMKVPSIREVNQATFSVNNKGTYSPFKTVELTATGEIYWASFVRDNGVPVCRIRVFSGGNVLYAPKSILRIVDKPSKALPINIAEINHA